MSVIDSGELYTWGRGSFGRLGLGSNEDQWIPNKVNRVDVISFWFICKCILKLCTVIIISMANYHNMEWKIGNFQIREFNRKGC